ncbi:MAG: DMT family transporter, partial [Rhizobiales bacterium]|nr:DMT family transporter [Hyphomicrobiales bacterium]
MSEGAPAAKLGRGPASGFLLIMGTCWGLQFAMLKLAAGGGYSELAVLVLAMALLSVVFMAVLVARRQLFRLTAERIGFLLVTSILGYLAPLWAALYAASHLPAGILTLMASLTPVATVAFALSLRTEVVSLRRIFAVVLGAAAVCLVLWPELELPGFGKLHWLLVALVMPLCYGVESIYIARFWPSGMTPLQAVTGETVMALALVVPIFLVAGGPLPAPHWGAAELAIGLFVAAGVVESMLYF